MSCSGGPLGLGHQSKNPFGQEPTFFHRLVQRVAERRQDLQLERTERPGRVREWWQVTDKPSVAMGSFVWPLNSFSTLGGRLAAFFGPTRYLASDRSDRGDFGGNQLSNPDARAAVQFVRSDGQPPAIRAGQAQGRPTVRSRLTSFGQRVPPTNQVYPSEEV